MRLSACAVTSALILCLLSAPAPAAVNARDHGAKGDGTTDDTAAIQAALDAASPAGDIVTLPAGTYRVNGTLSVPVGVTLEGIWPGQHTSHLDKGSVLLAYAGRDNEDSTPFIQLHTSSALKGVTIFYPEQKVGDIHPYPWTIQGRGQHYNILDTTLVNAYNGVDCGTFHNEGHHLRNVHLCALRRGLYIDRCSDVGRTENVHIHNVYWWRVSPPYTLTPEQVEALEAYTKEHLVGFIIGRTDWEYMTNCFVIWARVGFHFISTPAGLANCVITQSGSDLGPLAVQVDAVQRHAGVAFENCQFMSGFDIHPTNSGPVKLTNCGFWGTAGSGSQIVASGTGTVTLVATHFEGWPTGQPCIQALNGSLLMQACEVNMERAGALAHVYLGPDLQSAAIIGNRFRKGGPAIVNEARNKDQVQILGNVTE